MGNLLPGALGMTTMQHSLTSQHRCQREARPPARIHKDIVQASQIVVRVHVVLRDQAVQRDAMVVANVHIRVRRAKHENVLSGGGTSAARNPCTFAREAFHHLPRIVLRAPVQYIMDVLAQRVHHSFQDMLWRWFIGLQCVVDQHPEVADGSFHHLLHL
jgi:hypothetical protein